MTQVIANFFKKRKKVLPFLVITALILVISLPIFILIKIPLFIILAIVLWINLKPFQKTYKNNKFLAILTIFPYTIVALFFLFFVFMVHKKIQVNTTQAPTKRNYVDYITSVVEPPAQTLLKPKDITKMKQDNINTLTLYPSTYLPSYLSFFYQFEKPFLIGVAKEAKRQGLAVHISGQSGPEPASEEAYAKRLDLINTRVLEWAEISEELGAEYFTPWTEVDAMGREKAIAWHEEILPKIRKRFSGKVLAGWTCCSSDDVYTRDLPDTPWNEKGRGIGLVNGFKKRIEVSGDFDGVSLNIPTGHLEEWQIKYFWDSSLEPQPGDPGRFPSLEELVTTAAETADKMGIPLYLGELYVNTQKAPFGLNKDSIIYNEKEQADFIKKYLDTVMPYCDGVGLCFWDSAGGVKDRLAEQVIKEKFEKVNK